MRCGAPDSPKRTAFDSTKERTHEAVRVTATGASGARLRESGAITRIDATSGCDVARSRRWHETPPLLGQPARLQRRPWNTMGDTANGRRSFSLQALTQNEGGRMARELPYSLEEVMRILLSSLTSQPDPRFEEVRSHLDGTWKAWSRDDHLADDASQETWAKMLAGGFRKLEQMHSHDRFSSVRSLEAYLFLAFRNQWR